MTNKVYSMLGLCMKAGKLKAGADVCIDNIKSGNVYLVIIAEDASPSTIEKFKYITDECNTPMILYGLKDELSTAIGKDNKVIFAITDEGFSKRILELVKELKGANI